MIMLILASWATPSLVGPDVDHLFLGASKDVPWGSKQPAYPAGQCQERKNGITKCRHSDWAADAATRYEDHRVYCHGRLASTTTYMYGKEMKAFSLLLSGAFQARAGAATAITNGQQWTRNGTVVQLRGPDAALPSPLNLAYTVTTWSIAELSAC